MSYHLLQSSDVSSLRATLKFLLPTYELKEQITQNLIKVWERFPQELDETLFKQADLLFVLTNDEFREQRSQKHLTRMIFSLFVIQRNLRKLVTLFGEKRHLHFRLVQTSLKFPFGSKSVLSFIGGICLFDKNETFEEKHLLLAAQKFIPELRIIKHTVLLYHDPEDSIRLIYVEFEKKEGEGFTCEEIALLKRGLETELQVRIAKNIPALFMIRNEEEVMKNILILSRELDLSHEIPEVIINFELQRPSALSFTIILVRILKKNSKTIEKLFQSLPSGVRFTLDRNQIIGYLNDKYPKEATVFRLEIPLEKNFLRADFSINFYLARQKIKSILLKAIGPIRDFNGGMILKQGELLAQFKESFQEIAEKDPLLIENFFYSLSPIEKQITLPLHLLCTLFTLFLEATKECPLNGDPFTLKVLDENKNIFAVIKSDDFSLFKTLEQTIGPLRLKENFITFKLNVKNSLVMGLIQTKEKNPEHAIDLANHLDEAIKIWNQERQKRQVAKLVVRHVPTSFDPRIGGDEDSRSLLKMLFEGLMRIGKDGKPAYALAESITLSQDRKTYIFHLRPSYWSDGNPLIAYDFEYAWKKILSPEFKTPFASFFFSIKNARLVKEGTVSLCELGVKAVDDYSLQVTLEHSTSYFLELVALPLFSPISHKSDLIHPNWAFQEGEAYICNGPFCLKRKNHNYGYELIKNVKYWDVQSVKLDQIFITKIKDFSAYEMFEKGFIDWIGRPFPSSDPAYVKRHSKNMSSHPSSRVSWCVYNTQCFPFNNQKIRQALSCSIDKEKLISLLNYEDALPATSPIPLNRSQNISNVRDKFNPEAAKQYFYDGLAELGLQKKDFPLITLFSPTVALHTQTARLIQQQWEEIFGISCKLIFMEWPELFSKICQGDYEASLLTWTSCVNDPTYTLNAFKYSHDGINFSKWENATYQQLLDSASQEEEPNQYLNAAEKILINEKPVNPLFFEKNHYINQDHFHVDYDLLKGEADFKWAYIKK